MHASRIPPPRLRNKTGLEKPRSLCVDFAISLVVWPTVNTSVQHHSKASPFYNLTRLVHTESWEKKGDKKSDCSFFCFLFFDGWIIQVMWWDNESCILSVNMEDAPRVNHGQEAVKRLVFFSLLFLIGIEWNVRCLVNVVLNPFKQKRNELPSKRPCYLLLDCLWSKFIQFVISTSCLGMFRSSWG